MSNWAVKHINELGTISRGRSRHRPRDDKSLYGGEYPFVQTADVKASEFYLSKYSQTYNENGLAQSKLWKRGTLCITIAANIAETAILDIDACFPDSIVGFIPFDGEADVRFVKYSFDMLKKEMQLASLGATQDNFSVEKMLKFKFIVPDFNKQKRIADILSTYDDLIENNNRRIELLEKAAQELYKEWFVRFRFPNHDNTKFVNGLPEGWEIRQLDDIANLVMGQSPSSEFYNKEGIGLAFHQGVTNFNRRFPTHNVFCTQVKKTANIGDILLSVRAPVGRINIANDKIVIGRGLCAINHKRKHNTLLYYQLISYFHKEDIIGNGSIFNSVGKEELCKIKIISPRDEIINAFERLVENIDNQINTLDVKNQNLKKQRDLLLPRLMSGRLEV